jgi:hypothetical protein
MIDFFYVLQATFLVYLNEDFEGGATLFPGTNATFSSNMTNLRDPTLCDMHDKGFLRAYPKAGAAALFYNVLCVVLSFALRCFGILTRERSCMQHVVRKVK